VAAGTAIAQQRNSDNAAATHHSRNNKAPVAAFLDTRRNFRVISRCKMHLA